MKNNAFSAFGNPGRVGVSFLRIVETGQVVKWIGFDEKTQEYDVESAVGEISSIAGTKVSKDVTPEEEAEFLRRQTKK
jgi:hypothetical protein